MRKLDAQMEELGAAVLIPTYNNDRYLAGVLDDVLAETSHVIVINDGATDSTPDILASFGDRITVFDQGHNQGKGAGLQRGYKEAAKLGYKYILTLDSDGQHRASDIPVFLEKLKEVPGSLIVGARNMGQENVPGKSSFGHKFSNFWYRVDTGIDLPDTQTGYRMYPLETVNKINFWTTKFEFEVEVLVKSAWRDIPVLAVPIDVYYPPRDERITHFRPFKDFTRISILNTWFFIAAILWFRPILFFKRLRRKGLRAWWKENIVKPEESPGRKAMAVALGVFVGIAPLWGWQTLIAIAGAHLFKLNKALAFAASNISIPPMIPVIVFGSIWIGCAIMGIEFNKEIFFPEEFSWEKIGGNLTVYLVGSFALAFLAALGLGGITFALLKLTMRS